MTGRWGHCSALWTAAFICRLWNKCQGPCGYSQPQAWGQRREKRRQGGVWIRPKERSPNSRHMLRSHGESEDKAGSGTPGLTPCHGEHLIPMAYMSPPAPLQIPPALVLTWPRAQLLTGAPPQPALPGPLLHRRPLSSTFKNLCHPLHSWQLKFLEPRQTTKPSGSGTSMFQ